MQPPLTYWCNEECNVYAGSVGGWLTTYSKVWNELLVFNCSQMQRERKVVFFFQIKQVISVTSEMEWNILTCEHSLCICTCNQVRSIASDCVCQSHCCKFFLCKQPESAMPASGWSCKGAWMDCQTRTPFSAGKYLLKGEEGADITLQFHILLLAVKMLSTFKCSLSNPMNYLFSSVLFTLKQYLEKWRSKCK